MLNLTLYRETTRSKAARLEAEQVQSAPTRRGKVAARPKKVARPPQPVEGPIDYDGLITKAMNRYPNTRDYLAE
jgi:hypothetical protein